MATWANFCVLHLAVCVCVAMEAADPPTVCFNEPSSPALEMFVDELPILQVLNATTGKTITLGAYKIEQKLHRDLPHTTLYGFGTSQATASYPGPTLEAQRWVPTRVRWENRIEDDSHFLPVDTTLHIPQLQNGGVPMVIHLHGGETPSYSDGNPDAWFTSRGEIGTSYVTREYLYPNHQPATMLWYHDHTDGMTRLNVAAGLLGLYIIRSPLDDANVSLPSGSYEVSLLFQDKRFFSNGHIRFPSIGALPVVHPVWCPDYLGDTMLVNGKVWPFFNVEPRRYRFRMLNGNTERYLHLSLLTSAGSSLPFIQIGTDGGYISQPIRLATILLASAERVDVIIDFGGFTQGTEVFLLNSARAPYPNGAMLPGNASSVMKFIVTAAATAVTTNPEIPKVLRNQSAMILPLKGTETIRRHFLLDMYSSLSSTRPVELLLNGRHWRDAATEIVDRGSTEIWEIVNPTNQAHPIHIHLVNFQVLSWQRFNVESYKNQSCFLDVSYPNTGSCFYGDPETPLPYMLGWKDTVTMLPNVVTRIVIRFTTQNGSAFAFDATAFPGYLWHCHLLGHEDNDMMRPLLLT